MHNGVIEKQKIRIVIKTIFCCFISLQIFFPVMAMLRILFHLPIRKRRGATIFNLPLSNKCMAAFLRNIPVLIA